MFHVEHMFCCGLTRVAIEVFKSGTDAMTGKEAMMGNNQGKQGSHTPLARLIDQVGQRATDSSLWERLDMDRVARRVIQAARIATAEHAMQRVERAVRLRDESKNRPATA